MRGEINQRFLNLWYYHWMVNIAGFRGHVHPGHSATSTGSYYLASNTYRAMSRLRELLNNMLQDPDFNPMDPYLASRGEWLGLHLRNEPESDEFFALALLGANLRFYSQRDGEQLLLQFRSLPQGTRNSWIQRARQQRTEMAGPAPTYLPAVYANAMERGGHAIIPRFLSIVLAAFEDEIRLRGAGLLNNIPVSFREVASNGTISEVLNDPSFDNYRVTINPADGIVTILAQ